MGSHFEKPEDQTDGAMNEQGADGNDIEGNRDLQKEFHLLQAEKGGAAAMEFLRDNYDRNPRFVERQALRLSREVMKQWNEALIRSSAENFRAQLYVEYRELSERQKTLRGGGFKHFVEEKLNEMPPNEGDDEAIDRDRYFRSFVIKDLDRYPSFRMAGNEEVLITERLNYRDAANTSMAQTEEIGRMQTAINDILERSEDIEEAA